MARQHLSTAYCKPYLHDSQISTPSFRRLGYLMAALAGAINAGGFFAVARYTSHVTGALSTAADMVYQEDWYTALYYLSGVIAFILGATHSGWTILWAKRQRFRSSYGLSMWLEAVYLLLFGLVGFFIAGSEIVQISLFLMLCFIMGMHNTVITVLSHSVIRSTHMTGVATDLGTELAKVLYYSKSQNPRLPNVRVDRPKMKLLVGLFLSFLVGGGVGAWGYHKVSYHFTLPVATVLFFTGYKSIRYDIKVRLRLWLLRKKKDFTK